MKDSEVRLNEVFEFLASEARFSPEAVEKVKSLIDERYYTTGTARVEASRAAHLRRTFIVSTDARTKQRRAVRALALCRSTTEARRPHLQHPVERIVDEIKHRDYASLLADLKTFERAIAAPPPAPTTVRPPAPLPQAPTTKGWILGNIAGERHPYIVQTETYACVMAAAAAVVWRVTGAKPTETAMKQASAQHGGGYKRMFEDSAAKPVKLPYAPDKIRQPAPPGTNSRETLAPTLRDQGVQVKETAQPDFATLKSALDQATIETPVVLLEPAHVIVCDGLHRSGSGYVVCDPGFAQPFIATLAHDGRSPSLEYNNRSFPITWMWECS